MALITIRGARLLRVAIAEPKRPPAAGPLLPTASALVATDGSAQASLPHGWSSAAPVSRLG